MTLEEVKKEIENKTGVPASFLTGETVEENIAQAKALLAYKSKQQGTEARPEPGTDPNKSTKEQFADWISGKFKTYTPEAEPETWEGIEEAGGIYPKIKDTGEASKANTSFKSAALQFAEFISNHF